MNLCILFADEKKRPLKMLTLLILLAVAVLFLPKKAWATEKQMTYTDDIYQYIITDEDKREVSLIGLTIRTTMMELLIPGKVLIQEQEYTVAALDIHWNYYENTADKRFYESVKKLIFADSFRGIVEQPLFAFPQVRTLEFLGTTAPQGIRVSLSNRSTNPDIVFLVPEGTEAAYRGIIEETMSYYNGSDLYEMDLPMRPTIITKETDKIENGVFSRDGLLYQVTASARNGRGKVQLIGITNEKKHPYLKLPKELTNNDFTYELTKLSKFSLVRIGATVIVVPDTVTEMESSVFDRQLELLFLSKNCKLIPGNMITDENNESSLRFVAVPEGVTTISDNAFANIMKNEGSIILPSSIKTLGKQSLHSFKLVTFLNKKPINKLSAAIKNGSTVKVNSSSIAAYQKALASKFTIVSAKNVVKSTKLTVNSSSLSLNTSQTKTLKGTLSKGSNETVFWLSTEPSIFSISSQGVVNPKKAGSAYAIAYTRTSGLHQAVKITVTDHFITDGIYTFRVTDATRKTVSLSQIKPASTTKKLSIPETILYNKKTYTVTEALADPEDSGKPLIPASYKNKIEEISFPKSITGAVGYLGELKSIKSITFLGKSAPKAIMNWYDDGGFLAFNATIYVPKGTLAAYSSALWLSWDEDIYSFLRYGSRMDYHVLEIGSNQPQRFVKDGILYTVIKKAGSKNGEVAVKGADVTLTKITIKDTVTYGKYTYQVTRINKGALDQSKAKEIDISPNIKIQK